MHLGNVGAYIWIIAIVIAVVSRIVKSGRPAAPAVRPPAPATVAPTRGAMPPPAAQPAPRRRDALRHEPLVYTPLVTPEIPDVVAPPPMTGRIGRPAARRAGSLTSLFEDRGSMVRAIVAAEVLGPPKSLSEQGFWRPKHSEV